jgi:hypothetical protein
MSNRGIFFVGVALGALLFAVVCVVTNTAPRPRPTILLDAGVE